jgi:hypothetical protein
MHSLVELKNYLLEREIKIRKFDGWRLQVGSDVWTMAHDVFYRNNEPVNLKKDKSIFDSYKKETENDIESTQTRKWRGISSRNRRAE